jgi:translation initiation factor 3 subunit K
MAIASDLDDACLLTNGPTEPRNCSYQFNPHLAKEETITNILVKALTIFPSPDFSLCLHLLPPNILDATTATDALSDAVRKLTALNELIESGSYREFWAAYESDDLYADLVADCAGFEDTMRDAIALQIGMIAREVSKEIAQGWLNVSAEDLPEVVANYGWAVEGDIVKLPTNKENEAKTTVFRENVQFNRRCSIAARNGRRLMKCRVPERHSEGLRTGGLEHAENWNWHFGRCTYLVFNRGCAGKSCGGSYYCFFGVGESLGPGKQKANFLTRIQGVGVHDV